MPYLAAFKRFFAHLGSLWTLSRRAILARRPGLAEGSQFGRVVLEREEEVGFGFV